MAAPMHQMEVPFDNLGFFSNRIKTTAHESRIGEFMYSTWDYLITIRTRQLLLEAGYVFLIEDRLCGLRLIIAVHPRHGILE